MTSSNPEPLEPAADPVAGSSSADQPVTETAPVTESAPAPETSPESATAPEGEQVRAIDVVDPADVRRAPKFGAFITFGLLSGIVLGLIGGLIVFHGKPTSGWTLGIFVFDVTIITTIAALLWAIFADRRSVKKSRAR